MTEQTQQIKRDMTVWFDRAGTHFTATFECEFLLHITPSNEAMPRQVEVEWMDSYPISASFLDKDDNEFNWHFGENMPRPIAQAFERYEEMISDDLTNQALESRT